MCFICFLMFFIFMWYFVVWSKIIFCFKIFLGGVGGILWWVVGVCVGWDD